MTRDTDEDDQQAIDNAHVKIAETAVEGMIGGLIRVGGSPNDLMLLLESINSAIMIYLEALVPEFDVSNVTEQLMKNTVTRVTEIKKKNIN